MKQETWILGAPDPEMTHIESLLSEQGKTVAYATYWGKRVTARNAYQADGPVVSSGHVYLVECDIPALHQTGVSITRIDHHREGDPGYGLGPDQFLPASSIGQVIAAIGVNEFYRTHSDRWWITASAHDDEEGRLAKIYGDGWAYHPDRGWRLGQGDTALYAPADVILVAAADHCPLDAYQGRCPGVNPDALTRWRVESRAAFQRRSVEAVTADIERAKQELRKADLLPGAPGEIRNLLWHPPIPELPEAALQEGVAFMAALPRGTETQVVLQCASPEEVTWFLSEFPAKDKYGDPARGFAGGYIA
jgi:hypothetical protein